MLKIENVEVYGWEAAIRGMRNPLNSWARSDSDYKFTDPGNCGKDGWVLYCVGEDDLDLMKRLAACGSTHAKYRRMITVTLDIIAPLYWWKEFDTYKVGTVANSCSTMHKIHAKEFTLDDFSHERLTGGALVALKSVIIPQLNEDRLKYLETKDKQYWDNMIQLLTTSYNQRRTVLLNYEVLTAIYRDRQNHKLKEWHTLCDWIEGMPHSEIITG
jgi:hypothetical protein